jgi:hypothetical protein
LKVNLCRPFSSQQIHAFRRHTRSSRTSCAKSGFAPSVTVQKVTSSPKRRSRCAKSIVQMLVVGQSDRKAGKSHCLAPSARRIISTQAKPQSLCTARAALRVRPLRSSSSQSFSAAVVPIKCLSYVRHLHATLWRLRLEGRFTRGVNCSLSHPGPRRCAPCQHESTQPPTQRLQVDDIASYGRLESIPQVSLAITCHLAIGQKHGPFARSVSQLGSVAGHCLQLL